ncbi:hypothetical protein KJ682_02020, partial [bacterium]|nr:hypothetical protein [bacterium]
MRFTVKILLAVLALASLPVAVQAQQLFDFNGQALLPAGTGGTLTMHSIVYDAAPATPPIPLDFANYEFTIVVENLIL